MEGQGDTPLARILGQPLGIEDHAHLARGGIVAHIELLVLDLVAQLVIHGLFRALLGLDAHNAGIAGGGNGGIPITLRPAETFSSKPVVRSPSTVI